MYSMFDYGLSQIGALFWFLFKIGWWLIKGAWEIKKQREEVWHDGQNQPTE